MPDLDAPLPVRPSLFLCHYARRRPWLFGALLLLIVAASPCSVGVQYGMKLIVNAMVGDDYTSDTIWRWLALFVLLITAERACWRLSGWFDCRAVVATGVDVRLDMFRYLSGHAMDYFAQQHGRLAGQPGAATAGATGSVYGTWIWKILLPCIDFVSAVIVWLRPSTRAWPWH